MMQWRAYNGPMARTRVTWRVTDVVSMMRASDSAAAARSNRTVLVVEDDPAIGNMLTTLLAVEGYRPILIVDGLEGLAAAQLLHPALITLDLSLPGLDGFRFLDRLDQPDLPRIPVIIVSAYTDQLTALHRARVSAIVTKPFEIETLLGCISVALGTN
jgi:two-component system response regulator VicR